MDKFWQAAAITVPCCEQRTEEVEEEEVE